MATDMQSFINQTRAGQPLTGWNSSVAPASSLLAVPALSPNVQSARVAPVALAQTQPAYAQMPQTQPAPIYQSNSATDTFNYQAIDKNSLKQEIKDELKSELKGELETEEKIKQEEENKKKKLGPVSKFKRFIGNVQKFGSTVWEFTKGTVKGIVKGGIAGGALFGGMTLASKALNKKMPDTSNKIIKAVQNKTAAKALGAVGFVLGLGVSLWNTSIKANEKRAFIEHKWEHTPVIRK